MNIKRTVSLVIIALSITMLNCSCAKKEVKKVTYTSEYGMTLSYPEDWDMKKEEQTPSVPILIIKNEDVPDEVFKSNINLSVISHKGEELDFDKFMQINKNYLLVNNIKIVDQEATKIDGHDAYKLVYHMTDDGDALTLVQYLQLYDEVGYTITFICLDKNYDALKEEATDIIKSFKYDFNK